MVRLKLSGDIDRLNGSAGFQFHNGSIKAKNKGNKMQSVRIFQFHNGSIKAVNDKFPSAPFRIFQFHNGSIKAKKPDSITPRTGEISIPQWFD